MISKNIVYVAIDPNGVMGKGNELPWPRGTLKGDLPRLKETTTNHVVVMGWDTMMSLKRPGTAPDESPKPLPDRHNYVLSRDSKKIAPEGFTKCFSLAQVIHRYEHSDKNVYIIGGRGPIEEAINTGVVDEMIITQTYDEYEGDVYFPKIDWSEWKIDETRSQDYPELRYRVTVYVRKSKSEHVH